MFGSRFYTPPVVKNLLIANAIIFLAMWLIPFVGAFIDYYGALYWVGNENFHTYQFITYMFLHADFGHLFSNMFALWMFGRTLEYELGSKRFLTYYLVCGVGAALIQMLVAFIFGETGFTLVGASGAVMGLLLAFGFMHPNETIYIIPIPFPIKAKWFVVGYAVLELVMGYTSMRSFAPSLGFNVAHFAHIGGMLWGLLLLLYWRRRR